MFQWEWVLDLLLLLSKTNFMTPRSLFVILIKIMGLFQISNIFESALGLFASLFTLRSEVSSSGLQYMLFSLFSLGLYILLFYVLLFKPQVLIDRLKLDHGFYEEQFTMNMNMGMVVRIAIISVGIFFFIETIPSLCRQLAIVYQKAALHYFSDKSDDTTINIIFSVAKLLIGYVMLTNSNYLAKFITKNAIEQEK